MPNNALSIIILAAGKGTRMKSNLPKVLHKVAGRSMIDLVIDSAKNLQPKNITIVSSQDVLDLKQDQISNQNNQNIKYVLQQDKLGTGHAVKIALEDLKQNIADKYLVLYGDTPLISSDTIKEIADKLDDFNVCVAAFKCNQANMYGRLVIDKKGDLQKIIEFKDANYQEKEITLCNSGIMAFRGDKIHDLINKIDNKNNSQEYYLTDIVDIALKQNLKVGYSVIDEEEVIGVNSKLELSIVENIKQQKLRHKLMQDGVTLIDPNSIFLSYDVKIGQDCIIEPNVTLGIGVEIGNNVTIKSFSYIEQSKISDNCNIGPFARLRPESEIGDNCKIGNFVEIKKSQISQNTNISHLSYVGDSVVGQNCNIGAGTITCNYDGLKKHQTKIGDNSFIGSNCSLIAPLNIADNCLIGAGSVVTKNTENGDLVIARSKQINIKNGNKKKK